MYIITVFLSTILCQSIPVPNLDCFLVHLYSFCLGQFKSGERQLLLLILYKLLKLLEKISKHSFGKNSMRIQSLMILILTVSSNLQFTFPDLWQSCFSLLCQIFFFFLKYPWPLPLTFSISSVYPLSWMSEKIRTS